MKRAPAVGMSSLVWLLTAVLCAVMTPAALADALVVTRAMSATTIAEFYLEDGSISLHLEIGAADLEVFSGILPDEIYTKVTGQSEPLSSRLQKFQEKGLTLKADGVLLIGTLDHLEVRRRVVRDVITGEPLAVQPADAEYVVEVRLTYQLPDRPQTLSVAPPGRHDTPVRFADIGFIVYHAGLPVTDFRYLSGEETLEPDWDDPWYSRFRNRNLRRQFDAPLSAFLYVENFEVRKEIIIRPRDLQHWVDLGIEGKQVLPIAEQAALKDRVAEFLLERGPVSIDGQIRTPTLDRIHFIRRTARRTGVIDPPEDLDLTAATLGVIFVYPIERLPETVQMEWDLFSDRIPQVPTVATDEAGGLPYTVSPDDPHLVWQNFLTSPTVPAMISIAPPPAAPQWSVPVVSVLAALLAVGMILTAVRRRQSQSVRSLLAVGGSLMLVAVVCLPVGRATIPDPLNSTPPLSQPEVEQLLGDLLHNVYRAFDRRDERLIYDRLATSISGDLLTDVYIQVRSSMELENQGGARVKIADVTLQEAVVEEQLEEGGFVARCDWRAFGSVGHWGHIHQQINKYSANVTVSVVDDVWTITQLDLNSVNRTVPTAGP